ncbi:hypothetical protein FNJ84_17110 [Paracoccus sp. M683]|uniref:hypothetical protein n=1 Tax=Paracoccus sp. M683 TaxID=2594268 RepID=UPI00117E6A12|nr:hypothetical protein [Paracoccus sp. M683]TRW95211.1 hypothetical protein FNJ84_17110 [Paracoccus sp. M683]
MAEPGQAFNYYLYIAGEGAFYDIRINDVSIHRDFDGGQANMTLPVNTYLTSAENTVSFRFVSVMGDPYEYNVANPDFFVDAQMQRLDLVSRERANLTVLGLQLDETNRIVFPEINTFGLPAQTGDARLGLIGKARINDQLVLDSGWGDSWPAREVQRSFTVTGDFPDPVWLKGQVLENTPQMRADLLAAYADLHRVIAGGDEAAITEAYREVWQHTAVTANFGTLEGFLEKASPMKQLAPVNAAGETLQPLDLVLGEKDFQIQMMGGGRLVRIIPDPIIWSAVPGSDHVTSTNVAFYRDADGRFRIGAVLF